MKQFTYLDYLREAFYRKVPVRGLGEMPANVMALGVISVLGMANPGFWLLGAAAEVIYQVGVAGSKRFQKLIQGERLLDAQRAWEKDVARVVDRLDEDGARRYRRLLATCRSILGIADTLGSGDSLGNLRDLRARNLNQLLMLFLRLLGSRQVIAENIRTVDVAVLRRDTVRLEQEASKSTDEALKRSLEGTLQIQKKRLENQERALANLRVVEAELERIEQQVELIREETAISGSPRFLSDKLDAVSGALAETSKFLEQHADFLTTLGGEEATAVPALPQLPAELEG